MALYLVQRFSFDSQIIEYPLGILYAAILNYRIKVSLCLFGQILAPTPFKLYISTTSSFFAIQAMVCSRFYPMCDYHRTVSLEGTFHTILSILIK
jgi:hypothetical protein